MSDFHIERHIDRLFADCRLIELAARHEGQWHRGGIFESPAELKRALAEIGDSADLYTTINEPAPRSAGNRLGHGRGLSNKDFVRRRRLAFDIDAARADGFDKHNASNRELMRAVHIAGRLQNELVQKCDWPDPAFVFSGNGAHVIFRADIEATDEADKLIRQLYDTLAVHFASPQAVFDRAVHNIGRILRLPGSWNIGKTATPDRPSRQARVLTPDTWRPVTLDDVADLLARFGVKPKRKPLPTRAGGLVGGAGDYRTLDIVGWFTSRGHYKRRMREHKHAVRCPWHTEHSTEDQPEHTGTVIWEATDGWPTFHCSHAHCAGRTLRDVLALWPDADDFCARRFDGGRMPACIS